MNGALSVIENEVMVNFLFYNVSRVSSSLLGNEISRQDSDLRPLHELVTTKCVVHVYKPTNERE